MEQKRALAAAAAERERSLFGDPAPPADRSCGECESGWRRVIDQQGVERVGRCACQLSSVPASLPLEFREASLENFEAHAGGDDALAAAKEYLARLKADLASAGDLYLFGGIGAGKTRLACSILSSFYREVQRRGLFARVPRLLLDLQRTWSGDPEQRAEASALIETLYSEPLLVLDDVGVEKGSDYTRRTLYTVYEARCDRGLRTIWTSNLGLPELGRFLGDDRLPSRIVGRAEILFLECSDQRVARRGRR